MGQWRTAVIISTALLVVGVAACGGDSSSDVDSAPSSPPPASPTSSSASTAAPTFTVLDVVGEPLDLYGDWLTAGVGAVWLTNDTGVVRLDEATGEQVAEIAVPQGACESTTTGLGMVWTATCGEPGVVRIDPTTNEVTGNAALPAGTFLESEGTIGAGSGSVWLAADGQTCQDCRVARIDATTMEVTAMIPVSRGATSVRYGFGHVWVVNPGKNLVEKVDPETETVVLSAQTGGQPRFFDVGEGAVWTLDQADGTVTRIEPRSGRTTIIEAGVPGGGGDLAVGGGWVWARGGGAPLLVRIDPSRNEVVETYGPPSGSGAVTVGDDAVWVSAHDISRVWRLPLATIR